MNIHPAIWNQLGSLFRYPDGEYLPRLHQCRLALEPASCSASATEACEALLTMEETLAGLGLSDLEELYTRTFDLNPTCSLEVGWHLYGEQYERGRFLVRCRDLLAELGIEEAGELPDHTSLLVTALGSLPDSLAAPFSARFLLPALLVMEKVLHDKESPFEGLLTAAVVLAKERKGELETAQPRQRIDADLVQIGTGGKVPKPARRSFAAGRPVA